MTLVDRIHELVTIRGSLRAVARAFKVDVGYLSRLYHEQKTNPSDAVLRKLGLKKVINYELRKP